MKTKLLLGLGVLTTIATPIAVISCGKNKSAKTETIETKEPTTEEVAKNQNTKENTQTKESSQVGVVTGEKQIQKKKVLSFDGNVALFDMRAINGSDTDIKEISKSYLLVEDMFKNYINVWYTREGQDISNWITSFKNIDQRPSVVKVGFYIYANGEEKFRGYKFDANIFDSSVVDISGIVQLLQKEILARRSETDIYRMTGGFDTFTNDF